MKIGLYGGTFDPPHNGHLYLATEARRQLALDEVWVIPSGNPPHKDDDAVTSRCMRMDMCRLALDGHDGLVLKDFELYRSTQCYSYELLEWLRERFPREEFYFIMGEDSLALFASWRHPERIASCASLVVAVRESGGAVDENAARPQGEPAHIDKLATEIEQRFRTKVHLLKTDNVPIASHDIRRRVAKAYVHAQAGAVSITDAVNPAVADYIALHRLYRDNSTGGNDGKAVRHPLDGLPEAANIGLVEQRGSASLDEIRAHLQKKLKPSRYRHTIGVMETAANLAMRYRFPLQDARLAGLLHDCAKRYDDKKLRALCDEYGLPVTEAEERSPHLLHAKVGAYLAAARYGVTDPNVLHAIEVHTTGEPAMELLAQILYVADYIEPNRDRAKRLEEIRQLAYENLDVCTLLILEDTIAYLKNRGQPMDERTIETYRYYRDRLSRTTFQ